MKCLKGTVYFWYATKTLWDGDDIILKEPREYSYRCSLYIIKSSMTVAHDKLT